MKMEQIECSETSAYKIQTPGNYPEENIQQKQMKFILEDVCIHLNVPQEAIEYFMFQMLGAYSKAIRKIFSEQELRYRYPDSIGRRPQHGHKIE
jgi:hypothetical protein